jgi:hypothetical protein
MQSPSLGLLPILNVHLEERPLSQEVCAEHSMSKVTQTLTGIYKVIRKGLH